MMEIAKARSLSEQELAEELASARRHLYDLRFQLARKAFDHTAVYDRTIADFLVSKSINDVTTCYNLDPA